MNERQPIDDLFARALRDAEATPPPRVWEGVARERGWAHVTLVRLQRRWGLLSLLLLLGGAGAYWGFVGTQNDALALETGVASPTAAMESERNATHPSSPLITISLPEEQRTSAASSVDPEQPLATPQKKSEVTPQVERIAEAAAQLPVMAASQRFAPAGSTQSTLQPAMQNDKAQLESEHETIMEELAMNSPEVAVDNDIRGEAEVTASTGKNAFQTSLEQAVLATNKTTVNVQEQPIQEKAQAVAVHMTASAFADAGDARVLRVRRSELLPPALLAAPDARPTMEFIGPRRAWWLAATAGQFRETRTWHGADAELVNSLQSTELPHYPTGIGMLVGMEGRGGWGMAVGLEYNAGRYAYRHLDQFIQRTDSLVPVVITFNSDVIESYSDTLSTFAEQRQTVAAENRYTTLRVPLEASWNKAWHRWHFGARAGLAVEFNTQRSGATLVEAIGGLQSVDVATAPVKRTSTVLTGSVAADIGFGITERIGIWASPTYAVGLRSLSAAGDAPYAMPERLGVRVRLAYTLCPRP
ncbi:MAG: hypothetical protein IPL86_08165 [Flavobacteriales bacterium]|nr:hypothetical protein [Flavobacteriales bacterium]